ncbi:MAG: NAD(P)/FAD-dependent oxidoreductase [Rhodocyclaceae bacterium]|nr:NAD(P)/FAD-dependent oxidoreductase [Rhodocyclaceae bacterium]
MSAHNKDTSSTPLLDVVIIGAGFGGLCMAIQLRKAGYDNIVILEKAMDVGGTWRENSYPGAACDVQSHLYSFSFAPKTDWTKRYADWDEIQAYILDTTAKFGIRPFIRFGREVAGMRFDEGTAQWTVDTAQGEQYKARHVVMATGPLHVPNIPAFPGMDRFQGKVFHSAQWDHSYDLTGKHVVSIGTGGSAIQYAPEIAPKVAKLTIMQRTSAWVIPRDTRTYSRLSKVLFDKADWLRRLHRARLYWTNESRAWPLFAPALAKGFQSLAQWLIRSKVRNPNTAKALIPDYVIGCKRILISNKWLPMFNRINVDLVTSGIREFREKSIVTSEGREIKADCVVLGTGFVADPRIYMKNFPCIGLNGRNLMQADWKDIAQAYYGITVSGYPNFYQLVGPNTGLGHNSIVFMIEAQVHYVMQCLKLLKTEKADFLDLKPEAQKAFNEDLQHHFKGTVWSSGCKSYYQQADGRNVILWPKSTWKYWLETRKVRNQDYRILSCANSLIP